MIENPVTGERVRFLESDADRLRFEVVMGPHGFAPLAHVHPKQDGNEGRATGLPFGLLDHLSPVGAALARLLRVGLPVSVTER